MSRNDEVLFSRPLTTMATTNLRLTLLSGTILFCLFTGYIYKQTVNMPQITMNASPGDLNALTLTLETTTPRLRLTFTPTPLSLKITVHNPTSYPLTILRWSSPLDVSAPALGVFGARDTASGELAPCASIKFRRKTPPSLEDLVEILPGADVEMMHEVRVLGLAAGKTYNVSATGKWLSGWRCRKEDWHVGLFEGQGEGEGGSGTFGSNVVAVEVEDAQD
jgi:hypothetical protein